MALLSDGRMVIVFTGNDAVGNTGNTYARIIGVDGVPVGSDIPLATSIIGSTSDASVSALADGNFAVAWKSGSNVVMKAFDGAGVALTATPTPVTVATSASLPTMTTLADGRVLVTYYNNGPSAKIFSSDLATASAEIQLETTALDVLGDGVTNAASLTDGRFVVTWQSAVGATGTAFDIAARIFNADGTPAGAEFAVNFTTTDVQGQPNVIALADGGFLVSYASGPSNDPDLKGRFYTSAGVAGAEFAINTTTSGFQLDAEAVQLADGRVLFVWASNDSGNFDVRGRIVSADGTGASPDFVINSSTTNTQGHPDVQLLTDGRVVVTWETNESNPEFDVRMAIIDPLVFIGTSGVDVWTGGAAAERMYGDAGDDIFVGGAGDDLIYGGDGIDNLRGGDGNDILSGDAGIDLLFGDAGNDRMYGGAGNDQFNGGTGDDVMYGSVGNDVYFGSLGYGDALSFYSGTAVQVNLALGTFGGAAAGDSLGATSTSEVIEFLYGSLNGGDTLTGNSANNRIYGYGGNDTIDGGTYADTLDGGLGDDIIIGGSGNDVIYGRDGDDTITAGANNDMVLGGAGADTMDGGTGTDTLSYYYDTLGATVSLDGSVASAAGAAGDVIAVDTFENVYGSNVGNDSLTGSAVNNLMRGYIGNDILRGLAGVDRLEGGTGNDALYGGAGNDLLYGGYGDDLLVGGDGIDNIASEAGFDTIRFNALSEIGDKMVTFNVLEDQLQLAGSAFGGLAASATVATNRLETNTTGLATAAATRFIFETDSSKLWYDADGSGAAAAQLIIDFYNTTKGVFSAADIQII